MSADNGVYILRTPARNGGRFEYRVAHCQAIENLDYSHLYMPILFGNSDVFESLREATEAAGKILKSLPICEYGICDIRKNIIFPNMTSEEARRALDTYNDASSEIRPKHADHYVALEKGREADIRITFPSGKEIVLQWRLDHCSLDVCFPEGEGVSITTWEGAEMEPSKPHPKFSDGHVRKNCGQLVFDLGPSYEEEGW